MTILDFILEHKAVSAFIAIMCVTVIAIATQSDRLSDDWFPVDGFDFKVSPETALVGCLVIVLLGTLFAGGAPIGGPGN